MTTRPGRYTRPWYRKAISHAAVSPVLLWTLIRLRRRLLRDGLRAAVEEATPADRRLRRDAIRMSEWEQRMAACYEDDVISWWLVVLRVRSICLYQCLVMLDRLGRLPYVETLELVISAHHLAKGLDAHAWIVANGEVFRRRASTNPAAVVVVRLPRTL